MNIGLDFDGVISDCGKLKSEAAKRLYGVDIQPEQFKKEVVINNGLLTAAQYRDLQRIIYGTREIGFLMEPVAGALDYIPRLSSLGHTLLVVTSRGEREVEIAKEWSVTRGLTLAFISTRYGMSKAVACTGLDVYIDDDLDKLEPLVEIIPHRFLLSWGYNSHLETGVIARRVSSWHEFFEIITTLDLRQR